MGAHVLMRFLCVVAEYGGGTPTTGIDKDQYLGFVGIPKPPVSAHFSIRTSLTLTLVTQHVRTLFGARASRNMPLEARAGNASARLTRECCCGVCVATVCVCWREAARLHAAPGCLALHMA